jgi:RNA polymerase sigma factor (sigma-70 family)
MGLSPEDLESPSNGLQADRRPCAESGPSRDDSDLLVRVQTYLIYRQKSSSPPQLFEDAWQAFYECYSRKIRRYAFTCGAAEEDIVDCSQDVWTELLVRLPSFRLDPSRGKFDSWLFQIVRSKVVDVCRGHKHRLLHVKTDTLQNALDHHSCPTRSTEQEELLALALDRLRNSLTECTFQVLQMRLVGDRSVAEVAAKLGLSHEQVWYRYHRARRELQAIGLALTDPKPRPHPVSQRLPQKKRREGPKNGARDHRFFRITKCQSRHAVG